MSKITMNWRTYTHKQDTLVLFNEELSRQLGKYLGLCAQAFTVVMAQLPFKLSHPHYNNVICDK